MIRNYHHCKRIYGTIRSQAKLTDLVAANAASFQGLSGELLVFIRHKMYTEGELVDTGLLSPQIVDADLGIRDTAAEAGFGVGLVLAVTVTPGGTATHLEQSVWSE